MPRIIGRAIQRIDHPQRRRARRRLQPFFGLNRRVWIVRSDQIDDGLLGGCIGIGIKIAPAFGVNFARRQKTFAQHLAAGARNVQSKLQDDRT